MLNPGDQVHLAGTKKPFRLGNRLKGGSGGEGEIFETNVTGTVAKIYHSPASAKQVQKLKWMVAHPPDDPERSRGHASIAWPESLIVRDEAIVGFTMPKGPPGKLMVILSPRQRLAWDPGFLWDALILTAANVATGFGSIHRKGYVVGDVKPQNILLDREARVTFVDNDSFQVIERTGSSDVVHTCDVCSPGYLPPELFGCELRRTTRTVRHDAFGMSVLIYRLLMCNAHPFVGRWRGPGEVPVSDDRCVELGCYVHNEGALMQPLPIVPPIRALPPDVRDLFSRCFDTGLTDPSFRPTADEWRDALHGFLLNLTRCRKYPKRHWKHKHSDFCPWCELLRSKKPADYFGAIPVRRRPAQASRPSTRTRPRQRGPVSGLLHQNPTSNKGRPAALFVKPVRRWLRAVMSRLRRAP